MKKSILLLIAACCPLLVPAQEVLSLQTCLDMALKYNKEIAAAAKQTERARYMAASYRANFFPDFSASGTALYSTADGSFGIAGGNLPTFLPDNGEFVTTGGYAYFPGIDLDYKVGWMYTGGVQLDQPLYMGGKIIAANKMARLGRQLAQMNETLTATEVILQTNQAYAQVVKAMEMKLVAEKYGEVLAELMKNVESACRNGLKPQNDVLKVQVKLNESELNIRKAENGLRLASMNLCRLVGKPLTEEIHVVDDFPEVEDGLQMQVLDITSRPEYGILEKQTDIAGEQVRLSRSEMLPQVGIRGSYNYTHGLQINGQNLFDKGYFSVLLNVNMPLYHFGGRSNKVRAAKAQLALTRLQQESMNERMLLELTQAANELDEARLEREIAERSLRQAEENMRVSKNQYDVGLETLSDHLEAQALWQQAYQTHVEARFKLYVGYIAYLKASGALYGE
ncbi:MAG: TolC family protein [Prevotellaceae bacterium]|nr:TolC family protein [Prevotellaceae bacterium]